MECEGLKMWRIKNGLGRLGKGGGGGGSNECNCKLMKEGIISKVW